MSENDENNDYLINDFSSSKISTKNHNFKKKNLIIGIFVFFLIIIIVLIILLITNKYKSNNKIKKNIIGQINCIYKNEISLEPVQILGESYEKNSDFDILVDERIIKFTKIYKFSDFKEHKIEYHLYEEINMKEMFKNVSSLISVEMISKTKASIISIIGAFENCINLESFKI